MPRRAPYGSAPADQLAFVISLPVRRWALAHALKTGSVHARDLLREFPEYDTRFTAAEILYVLRDKGFLSPGETVLDIAGHRTQLSYTATPLARQAIQELHALVAALALEAQS